MTRDLRFVLRSLASQPTFTTVAVMTLALGLGANVAIFSVVNAVLLRPLPYPQPDRLVMVWQDLRLRGGPPDEWATPGNLADWRAASDVFSSLAAAVNWSPSLAGDEAPEQLAGAQVTADYFEVLRARTTAGRTFRADEDVPNAPRVALLSHGLWMRRFGGDRSVVGRTVQLSGDPHVVVGVLEAGFRPAIVTSAEIFRPLRLNLQTPWRGAVVLRVVGRLADGVTLERARARADQLALALEAAHPRTNRDARIAVVGLHRQVVGDVRSGLFVLLGAVALVLLVACVNVANLFLARGLTRGRELAVRSALGASRGRIVGLLISEGLVLALGGGALGLLLALWGVQALVYLAPVSLPRVDEIAIDVPVLLFALVASCATAIVFALVPALRLSGSDGSALKEGHRATGTAGTLRRALVVVEVALAAVLLVGAGLLVRSLTKLQSFDLGFDPRHVLAGRIVPSPVKYGDDQQLVTLYDRMLERAAAIPGVRLAALSSVVPFGGDSDMSFEIEGRPLPEQDDRQPVSWYRAVSSDYFTVMGLRLVGGRLFMASEPAPVVVINRTLARRQWPGEDPVGRRIRPGPNAPWFTIVGVVGDMRSRGPAGQLQAEMFVPYRFLAEGPMWVLLRARTASAGGVTSADDAPAPAALTAALRRAVADVDPDLPVASIQPMEDRLAAVLAQPQFVAALTAGFGALALLLGAFGIYGVMAYMVSRRTVEIGVRMALGAGMRDVLRLVMGECIGLAALGLALGAGAALLLSRWMRTLLFGIAPNDPLTFAMAALVLLGAALAASFVPARRAMRIDPHLALRME